MSNLIKHAKKEMQLAGLYDADADYAGTLPDAVMSLVKAHSKHGHSGGSHYLVLQIFNKVINFKTLTPLTNSPDEWVEVGDHVKQNTRQCSCFSEDGGKTYYDVDEEPRVIHRSKETDE